MSTKPVFAPVEGIPPSQQGAFLRKARGTSASKYDPYLTAVLASPGRTFKYEAGSPGRAGSVAQAFRNLIKKRKLTGVTAVSREDAVYLQFEPPQA